MPYQKSNIHLSRDDYSRGIADRRILCRTNLTRLSIVSELYLERTLCMFESLKDEKKKHGLLVATESRQMDNTETYK